MNVIAIDGPSGSGKGTISSILSKKLNYIYIDTGAMYRALTLFVLNNNISLDDELSIIDACLNINISFSKDNKILLNDVDISKEIRSQEVTDCVSIVSSIKKVREIMVAQQRKIAQNNNVVMEGRDITTVVFPDAKYKFYLDASVDVRARRRFLQNKENNIDIAYEKILESIKKRDYLDCNREVGALTRTNDQIYIDTTSLTILEVVDKIVAIVNKKDV